MFKPIFFSMTALSLSFTQVASANDYSILVEEGAFYPEITYLAPGDTVTFTNNNTYSIEVIASDETWTTEALATSMDYVLPISAETALAFGLVSDAEIAGTFSFDLAPLGDVNGDDDDAFDGTDGLESTN